MSGPLELELQQMLQAATWVLRPASSERASLLLTTKPVCSALRSPCNPTLSLHRGSCNAKTSMAKTSKTRERPAAGKCPQGVISKTMPSLNKGSMEILSRKPKHTHTGKYFMAGVIPEQERLKTFFSKFTVRFKKER